MVGRSCEQRRDVGASFAGAPTSRRLGRIASRSDVDEGRRRLERRPARRWPAPAARERWKSRALRRRPKAVGGLLDIRRERAQAGDGAALVVVVAGEQGESEQDVDRDRGAGGRGVVEEVARAGDQRLVVAAGVEEALHVVVPEQVDHLVRQLDRAERGSAARRSRCRVASRPSIEAGVVLEVAVDACAVALLPGAQQPAVGAHVATRGSRRCGRRRRGSVGESKASAASAKARSIMPFQA